MDHIHKFFKPKRRKTNLLFFLVLVSSSSCLMKAIKCDRIIKEINSRIRCSRKGLGSSFTTWYCEHDFHLILYLLLDSRLHTFVHVFMELQQQSKRPRQTNKIISVCLCSCSLQMEVPSFLHCFRVEGWPYARVLNFLRNFGCKLRSFTLIFGILIAGNLSWQAMHGPEIWMLHYYNPLEPKSLPVVVLSTEFKWIASWEQGKTALVLLTYRIQGYLYHIYHISYVSYVQLFINKYPLNLH